MHRLLKRQISQNLPSYESLPIEIQSFIDAINKTYEDYDKDIEHLEHVFKLSSQELIASNKQLNNINKQNEDIIFQKTLSLKKNQFILESAEKVAGFCALSINLTSNQIEITSQFKVFFPKFSNTSEFDLKLFFKQFNDSEIILELIENIFKDETHTSMQNLYNASIDKYFDIDFEILEGIDENKYLLIVLKDFTHRKLIEIEKENYLETINNYIRAIDAASIVSVTDEKGIIKNVNNEFCRVSGYTKDELIGSNHNIVNSSFHDKDFFNEMWQTIKNGGIWKGIVRNKSKNGDFYWVDSTIVPFKKNNKVYEYISIRFDITEKINSEKIISEQRNFYESILNNIPIDLAVFNKNHEYLFVSPQAVKSEERRKFLINKTDLDYCLKYNIDSSMAVTRRGYFTQALNNLTSSEFTDELTSSNGSKSYTLRRFSPILDNNGDFWMMVGYGIDVTDRILASKAVEESLYEKESLLGEIHHRVKNNLALIIGLIEMQSQRTEDAVLKNEMQIILRKIHAIGLIHEKLYKSNNFSKINICDYLDEFARISFKYFDNGSNAKFKLVCDHINLNTKQSIPLALLFNELLSNYFKYAIKGVSNPFMQLIITETDNVIRISVSDNGPGLPADFDISKTKSLGWKLISLFLKQLKAKYELKNDNGFVLNFEFVISS
jgi:PAS domain S-box-containing protein